MHIPEPTSECCKHYEVVPDEDICCFQPEVDKEWEKLKCRLKQLTTCRERLIRLAIPVRPISQRYVWKCPCKYTKPIEIVRLDHIQHTRTEQLAMTSVRRLLLFKERAKGIYFGARIDLLNRRIRQSLFSMYSRLGNVQPPVKPEKKKKWDEAEWKTHTKYLKKLAKPKKAPKIPKTPRKAMKLEQMTQYKTLALPKIRIEVEKEPWVLTPAAKNFQASKRLQEMAEPKQHDDSAIVRDLPVPVEPGALTYKATARIKELAQHRERNILESDLKEHPFTIAANALKAKASKRIQELAEPKEFEESNIRPVPWPISPTALKHKASPRLIELAKPKGS